MLRRLILLTDIKASMAEWSKATDSSSVLFGGVGSNPTGCNTFLFKEKNILYYYKDYMFNGGLAQSEERYVSNVQAPRSKLGFSIKNL